MWKYLLFIHDSENSRSKNEDVESGFSDLNLSESYYEHREIDRLSSEDLDAVSDLEHPNLQTPIEVMRHSVQSEQVKNQNSLIGARDRASKDRRRKRIY